jgi:transposase-like protein
MMMRGRGLPVNHTTVWRWVQRYAPESNKRMRPHLKMSGTSYRLDETYVKAGTEWKYLYRAIDSHGQAIEFMPSARRDVSAAKRFFKKMMRADHRRLPFTIGADKHASFPEAFAASVKDKSLPIDCGLRRVKCLNNVIEQGHRAIRRRWRAMQRFRPFHTAERRIEGNRCCAHDEERTGQKIGRQGRGGAGVVRRRGVRSRRPTQGHLEPLLGSE